MGFGEPVYSAHIKKIIPPEDHWLRAVPVIFGSLSLCSCRVLVPGHIWPAAQAAKQAPVDRESLWGKKKMQVLTVGSWANMDWSGRGAWTWAGHRQCLLQYYQKRTLNNSKYIGDSEILAIQALELRTTSDPLYFYFHFVFKTNTFFFLQIQRCKPQELTTKSDICYSNTLENAKFIVFSHQIKYTSLWRKYTNSFSPQ